MDVIRHAFAYQTVFTAGLVGGAFLMLFALALAASTWQGRIEHWSETMLRKTAQRLERKRVASLLREYGRGLGNQTVSANKLLEHLAKRVDDLRD